MGGKNNHKKSSKPPAHPYSQKNNANQPLPKQINPISWPNRNAQPHTNSQSQKPAVEDKIPVTTTIPQSISSTTTPSPTSLPQPDHAPFHLPSPSSPIAHDHPVQATQDSRGIIRKKRTWSSILLFIGIIWSIYLLSRNSTVQDLVSNTLEQTGLKNSIFSEVLNKPDLGNKLRSLKLSAKHPIILIPGIVSTSLEAWTAKYDENVSNYAGGDKSSQNGFFSAKLGINDPDLLNIESFLDKSYRNYIKTTENDQNPENATEIHPFDLLLNDIENIIDLFADSDLTDSQEKNIRLKMNSYSQHFSSNRTKSRSNHNDLSSPPIFPLNTSLNTSILSISPQPTLEQQKAIPTQTTTCLLPSHKTRIWGGKDMVTSLVLNSDCFVKYLKINSTTGLDSNFISLRPIEGVNGGDYLFANYWVWGRVVQLFDKLTDPNLVHMATYDWRLTYKANELRDLFFTRIKHRIEEMVAQHGEKVVIINHSMGGLVVQYLMNFISYQEYYENYPQGSGYSIDDEHNWFNRHIKSIVTIAAPMLGVPKATGAMLSGEMKDIAALGDIGNFARKVWTSFDDKAIISLLRSFHSVPSMFPKGGELVWGGIHHDYDKFYRNVIKSMESDRNQAKFTGSKPDLDFFEAPDDLWGFLPSEFDYTAHASDLLKLYGIKLRDNQRRHREDTCIQQEGNESCEHSDAIEWIEDDTDYFSLMSDMVQPFNEDAGYGLMSKIVADNAESILAKNSKKNKTTENLADSKLPAFFRDVLAQFDSWFTHNTGLKSLLSRESTEIEHNNEKSTKFSPHDSNSFDQDDPFYHVKKQLQHVWSMLSQRLPQNSTQRGQKSQKITSQAAFDALQDAEIPTIIENLAIPNQEPISIIEPNDLLSNLQLNAKKSVIWGFSTLLTGMISTIHSINANMALDHPKQSYISRTISNLSGVGCVVADVKPAITPAVAENGNNQANCFSNGSFNSIQFPLPTPQTQHKDETVKSSIRMAQHQQNTSLFKFASYLSDLLHVIQEKDAIYIPSSYQSHGDMVLMTKKHTFDDFFTQDKTLGVELVTHDENLGGENQDDVVVVDIISDTEQNDNSTKKVDQEKPEKIEKLNTTTTSDPNTKNNDIPFHIQSLPAATCYTDTTITNHDYTMMMAALQQSRLQPPKSPKSEEKLIELLTGRQILNESSNAHNSANFDASKPNFDRYNSITVCNKFKIDFISVFQSNLIKNIRHDLRTNGDGLDITDFFQTLLSYSYLAELPSSHDISPVLYYREPYYSYFNAQNAKNGIMAENARYDLDFVRILAKEWFYAVYKFIYLGRNNNHNFIYSWDIQFDVYMHKLRVAANAKVGLNGENTIDFINLPDVNEKATLRNTSAPVETTITIDNTLYNETYPTQTTRNVQRDKNHSIPIEAQSLPMAQESPQQTPHRSIDLAHELSDLIDVLDLIVMSYGDIIEHLSSIRAYNAGANCVLNDKHIYYINFPYSEKNQNSLKTGNVTKKETRSCIWDLMHREAPLYSEKMSYEYSFNHYLDIIHSLKIAPVPKSYHYQSIFYQNSIYNGNFGDLRVNNQFYVPPTGQGAILTYNYLHRISYMSNFWIDLPMLLPQPTQVVLNTSRSDSLSGNQKYDFMGINNNMGEKKGFVPSDEKYPYHGQEQLHVFNTQLLHNWTNSDNPLRNVNFIESSMIYHNWYYLVLDTERYFALQNKELTHMLKTLEKPAKYNTTATNRHNSIHFDNENDHEDYILFSYNAETDTFEVSPQFTSDFFLFEKNSREKDENNDQFGLIDDIIDIVCSLETDILPQFKNFNKMYSYDVNNSTNIEKSPLTCEKHRKSPTKSTRSHKKQYVSLLPLRYVSAYGLLYRHSGGASRQVLRSFYIDSAVKLPQNASQSESYYNDKMVKLQDLFNNNFIKNHQFNQLHGNYLLYNLIIDFYYNIILAKGHSKLANSTDIDAISREIVSNKVKLNYLHIVKQQLYSLSTYTVHLPSKNLSPSLSQAITITPQPFYPSSYYRIQPSLLSSIYHPKTTNIFSVTRHSADSIIPLSTYQQQFLTLKASTNPSSIIQHTLFHQDVDDREWTNILTTFLPKNTNFNLFNLYGVNKHSERNYYYDGVSSNYQPDLLFNTIQSEHDAIKAHQKFLQQQADQEHIQAETATARELVNNLTSITTNPNTTDTNFTVTPITSTHPHSPGSALSPSSVSLLPTVHINLAAVSRLGAVDLSSPLSSQNMQSAENYLTFFNSKHPHQNGVIVTNGDGTVPILSMGYVLGPGGLIDALETTRIKQLAEKGLGSKSDLKPGKIRRIITRQYDANVLYEPSFTQSSAPTIDEQHTFLQTSQNTPNSPTSTSIILTDDAHTTSTPTQVPRDLDTLLTFRLLSNDHVDIMGNDSLLLDLIHIIGKYNIPPVNTTKMSILETIAATKRKQANVGNARGYYEYKHQQEVYDLVKEQFSKLLEKYQQLTASKRSLLEKQKTVEKIAHDLSHALAIPLLLASPTIDEDRLKKEDQHRQLQALNAKHQHLQTDITVVDGVLSQVSALVNDYRRTLHDLQNHWIETVFNYFPLCNFTSQLPQFSPSITYRNLSTSVSEEPSVLHLAEYTQVKQLVETGQDCVTIEGEVYLKNRVVIPLQQQINIMNVRLLTQLPEVDESYA